METTLSRFAQERAVQKVKEYMMNGKSFTSVDITNDLKDDGVRIRNREVADMLRSLAIPIAHKYNCLYHLSLIRVDSNVDGPTWAYLYHHQTANPDDYLARDQNPKSFQTRQEIIDESQDNGAAQAILDMLKQKEAAVRSRANVDVASRTSATHNEHWKKQKRDSLGRFC